MTESDRLDRDALLAHATCVRALARYLTADVHTGDDLAQDAMAAALVRPPPSDRPLASWLAGIVRNLVRQDRRSAGRRAARERAVARDATDASSAQLLERLDTHRAVVDAIARLDEPYRAVILMRYFEGHSPAAIAAATNTPLRTVHTRLHRALGRLRSDLDRAHGGDRGTWLLALIPFARGSEGWSAAAIGALVMDAKLKVALALLAVVAVSATIVLWPSESGAARTALGNVALSETAAVPKDEHTAAPRLESVPSTVERRVQDDAPSKIEVAVPRVATPKLRGRVIDVERNPVASVIVRRVGTASVESEPAEGHTEATTDAAGAFELAGEHRTGTLEVASVGWTSLFRPDLAHEGARHAHASARDEVTLVIARSVTLRGVVVDEARRPIAAASVAVPLPFGLRSRFDTILDSASSVERGTKTDDEGRFELTDAPLAPGAVLMTSHATHVSDERAVPTHDDLSLEIVLRSVAKDETRILGTVIDVEGNPVEGAAVALGDASTKSGPGGAFALDIARAKDAEVSGASNTDVLRAAKRGHLPGEVVRSRDGAWPDPVTLQLGPAPLTIRGRVVDAAGDPVARAQIWTDEETRFGYVEIEGGEMRMRANASIEGVLRGDPWTRRTTTDADGAFELAGLLVRDYRIRALDQKRMLTIEIAVVAGTHDVEIRMPKEDLHQRVAGRVLSLSGDPVEGLEVALERRTAGAQGSRIDALTGFSTKTDADGRFAFADVSRAVNTIQVSGAGLGLVGSAHPIAPGDDVENLTVSVAMRVHVQIESGDPSEFDSVALLDEHDEKIYLSVYHGSSAYAMQDIPVQDGRTEPFSVSEAATTLVLYKAKVEVRRVPLKLVRGELNSIRP